MNSFHRLNSWTSRAVGSSDGFCRTDLLVGVAVVGFLGLLSLAAVARTQGESRWMVTLSNMKQLTAAWTLYARDNRDVLAPLAAGGSGGNFNDDALSWVGGFLDSRYQNPENTNTSFLVVPYGRTATSGRTHSAGLLGYYVQDPRLFISPNEPLCDSGYGKPFSRVRSLSMNPTLKGSNRSASGWQGNLRNQGYRIHTTMADLAGASPSATFVLITEKADTIDDGMFIVNMEDYVPYSHPSFLEAGGANLSFADGHVENWQWKGERFRRAPGPFWQPDYRQLTTDDEFFDLNRLRAVTATR